MVSVKSLTKQKSKKVHKIAKVEKVKKDVRNVSKELSSVVKESVTKIGTPIEIKNNKKAKYVLPSKYITEDRINSTLTALQQLTIHYQKNNKILEDESPIFAELNCIKIQSSHGNIKFVLPHSTVASTGEVCLITPDIKKGRKPDHEPTIDHWEEKLRQAGVTNVKTVLPMRQLRVEYDQYELKRRLLTQHDFIMVDTRVLNHVSHVLGKMFFKKHNMLIPVRINDKDDLKKQIDVGLRTVMLRLSEGATSTITVGHTAMPQKSVQENIMSLVNQLQQRYPGGEANIRSITIKLPLSISLPLYMTLRPVSSIIAPKLKHMKPKHFTEVEDELSTIPGSTVRVAPDGTVHLKKPKQGLGEESDENDGEESSEEEAKQDSD